jgi:hypothetical protein
MTRGRATRRTAESFHGSVNFLHAFVIMFNPPFGVLHKSDILK